MCLLHDPGAPCTALAAPIKANLTRMAVGIFSLFKKSTQPGSQAAQTTRQREGEDGAHAKRLANQSRQREVARATAMKIDAIESAMAQDIFHTHEPAPGRELRHAPALAPDWEDDGPPTLPMLDQQQTELLIDREETGPGAAPQTAPVIEEIAILFANNQLELARHMLVASLADVGQTERKPWWMLFDLYRITGAQDQFDDLSIDYASRFEVSPPPWIAVAPAAPAANAYPVLSSTELFSGILDQHIAPQLEHLAQLAKTIQVFRFEFGAITKVEPAGCALLLAALTMLRAMPRQLIVIGGPELAGQIRAIIAVGERGATEAPWLLLLELLQLMNLEQEFEDACIDYCITFEVSPPSFVAQPVAAVARQQSAAASNRLMLPAVVDGACGPLLDAIDAHAEQYERIVLDCSLLTRIDFGAAGDLLERLRPLAEGGKKIEFRGVNHLVAALFKLLDFDAVAPVFPIKY
jgi:ABC-type transporter Mla MlaB component